jgi:hypothetical protein
MNARREAVKRRRVAVEENVQSPKHGRVDASPLVQASDLEALEVRSEGLEALDVCCVVG